MISKEFSNLSLKMIFRNPKFKPTIFSNLSILVLQM